MLAVLLTQVELRQQLPDLWQSLATRARYPTLIFQGDGRTCHWNEHMSTCLKSIHGAYYYLQLALYANGCHGRQFSAQEQTAKFCEPRTVTWLGLGVFCGQWTICGLHQRLRGRR